MGIFYVCCSIGLFAQVMVANGLRAGGMNWPTATLAGIAVGLRVELLDGVPVRVAGPQAPDAALAEAYADAGAGANLMAARSATEIPPGY